MENKVGSPIESHTVVGWVPTTRANDVQPSATGVTITPGTIVTAPERLSIKVLLEAVEVQRKKSQDYQNPDSSVKQADYYPSGVKTIHEIIHGKILRARSLIETEGSPNYESLEDSFIDMINYCSFAVAYLRGGIPGQNPDHDMLNRPKKRS